MNFPGDLVRGSVVPLVLSLVDERPMYGYELVRAISERSNGVLEWKEGTVYPVLHRLEKEGLLKSEWKKVPLKGGDGTKERKYYAITRTGRAEMKKAVGEWKSFAAAVGMVIGK